MVHMSLPLLIQCGATVILSGNLSVSTDCWLSSRVSLTRRCTISGAVDRRVRRSDRCYWLGFQGREFLSLGGSGSYLAAVMATAPFASVASLGIQHFTNIILADCTSDRIFFFLEHFGKVRESANKWSS